MLAGLAFGLLLLFGLFQWWSRAPYSGLESFPVENYLERPRDFLGNSYRVRAQIDSQIEWRRNVGRLIVVRLEETDERLPVFVPSRTGSELHVGQRYEMRVRIEEKGLIYVEALRKY